MNQNLPDFEFDTTIFKDYLRSKLIALMEQLAGSKLLIFDQKVKQLINLSIEVKTLKETGVNEMSTLEIESIKPEFNQVVFIIPPKVECTKRVAQIIKNHEGIGQQKTYMLVFWPQRTVLCKEVLEQEQVVASVECKDFSFDLIPLDLDVLSLEMHDAFREMVIDYDLSIYNYVAESISRIQLVMGTIPNIYCKGDGAKMVYDILKMDQDDPQQGEIESLLIFDRSVDLLTPMLTQLVYEGLIDEFFNINGNIVSLDKKILGKEGDDQMLIQLASERDPLLYQVRNLLLAPLGLYLRDQAEQQERDKEEFNKEKSKNITEKMVQTAKKIKAEQESVQRHVNISTKITQEFRTIQFYKQLNNEQGMINGEKTEKTLDYLEAMVQVKEDLNKVMRLLAMRSLIDGGLKQKQFDYFRREIIQVYGFRTIEFLNNLQRSGLFTRQENTKPTWPKLQESLKLLDVDIRSDDPNPKDCAYTYSGHCPLIARLIETIFAKGTWKGIKSQMAMIPGAQIEPEKLVKPVSERRPIVLIYMLGGVTYGEISAFRLLGKKFSYLNKFILFIRQGNHHLHDQCHKRIEAYKFIEGTFMIIMQQYIIMNKQTDEVSNNKPIEESYFDDPDKPFTFWIKSHLIKKHKLDTNKLYEGHLFKQSSKSEFWKSRFFVLYRDRLNILKNGRERQEVASMFLLTIRLDLRRSEKTIVNEKDKFPLIFVSNQKELILYASSYDTYNKWVSVLRQCCILTNYRQTFTNLKVLGKGSFAKVLLGQRNSDKQEFAVKTFDKKNLTDKNRRLTILNEIQILRCCTHANIIKLFEVYESQKFIYIVMELLRGGELFDAIMSATTFHERTTSNIMYRLLSALDHLHQSNIMHRDIKPENIILKDNSQEYDIKLADFGLGAFVSQELQFKRCGTPGYVAPEILDDKKYDEKVDIFSAGVILYILLSGCSPFYAKSYSEIMQKNKACEINYDFYSMGIHVSNEGQIKYSYNYKASDLLQKMLQRDPKERISAKDALNHQFILQYNGDEAEQMAIFWDNQSVFLNMKRFFEERGELPKERPQGIVMQSPMMGFKNDQVDDGKKDSWLSDPCSPQNFFRAIGSPLLQKPMYVNQLMMQNQLNDNDSLNSSITNTPKTPVQSQFRSPKMDSQYMNKIKQAQMFFSQMQRLEQGKQQQFSQQQQIQPKNGYPFFPLQNQNENAIQQPLNQAFNKMPIKTDSQSSKTSLDKKASIVRNQLKKMGV